ncbi:MAG: glycosyltransferase family 2 protein [Planctomycetota bacterium]
MVSVVVVNWNGERYLGDCLRAVLAQQPPPGEVIVADNHSTDASRHLLATEFPEVTVLDLGSNLGPGAARNRGVSAARHDRVLCLDNDVILQPGVLAALACVLDADPQTAMVQARSVLAADPSVVHYDAADVHYLGLLVLHNWYRPLASATPIDRPVSGGVGLCFLVRKSAFLDVDGFNEPMFFFFEDNDFALRLRLRGHLVRVAADAVVLHRGGTDGLSMRGEGARYPERRTFLHSRNRWILLLTCLHWRTLILTLPAQLAYGVVHLAFAAGQGHFLAWWRGKLDLCRRLPDLWRRRRVVQSRRRCSDRSLLVAAPFTFNPQIGRRGLGGLARRLMDVAFIGYWRCVGWACG